MKIKRIYLLGLIMISMLALPVGARAFGIEAGVGYWKQTPSGPISYQSVDNLDLKDDMNFTSKNRPFARIKIDTPLFFPNIYFMATPMSFDGDGSKTFSFGGQNYVGAFTSRVKMDHYDAALYYTFLDKLSLGKLALDLGLDARMIAFEASVSNATVGETSKSLSLIVPMVYAALAVKPVKTFSVEAEGRGVAYGQNHYYDFIGRVKVKPIPLLYIAGGFRTEQLKIDTNDVKADVRISGPFVEAGISF